MVFQQYTSFEWKTVLQNVALPLILKGISKDEANEKAMEKRPERSLVSMAMKINGPNIRYSPAVSFKELQLPCNLVVNPQILLMDEPFGALDTVTLETDTGFSPLSVRKCQNRSDRHLCYTLRKRSCISFYRHLHTRFRACKQRTPLYY